MPKPPRTTPRLAKPAAHAYHNAHQDASHTSPARSRSRRHGRSPRARGCTCRTSPRASQREDLDHAQHHTSARRGSRVGGRSTPLLWARGRDSAIIWGCGRPACLLRACWLACSPSSSAAPTFTPARLAGRSGGHWACRGCGSMAIGGHGHVHACVPQGRRKDARYWTMTKHHFGRCTCLSSLGLVWTHPMKHRLSATQRANV